MPEFPPWRFQRQACEAQPLNELLNCFNMDDLVLKMLVFGRKVLEQLSAAGVRRLFRLKVTLNDELY